MGRVQAARMGCAASEVCAGNEEQVSTPTGNEQVAERPQKKIDLYVEKKDQHGKSSFAKQSCWCEPQMLFLGLYPTAISLGKKFCGWTDKDSPWEHLHAVISDQGQTSFPNSHQTISSLPACTDSGWNSCVWIYKSKSAPSQDNSNVSEGIKELCDNPSGEWGASEVVLDSLEGQLKVTVVCAVPTTPNDPRFTGEGEGTHEPDATTMYEASFWTTKKCIVEAVKDVANEAMKHLAPGIQLDKVTSYVLGDKDREFDGHPLLEFEGLDEIEDLDGFDEHLDNLQFILYSEPVDGKTSCGTNNFWALQQMMETYDNSKADVVTRVREDNKTFHDVENWPKVLQEAEAARKNRGD